jgi:predicted dehydrogenase
MTGSADPVRVGLFGAGPWARAVTGPIFAAGPETQLVGVWSRTPAHAKEAAAGLGVEAYDTAGALIEASDAIAVAVAPHAQPALASLAVEAGRPVLLEKPLADNLEDAHRLVDAIERARVGSLLVLTYRFHTALERFARAVEDLDVLGGRGCFLSGAFLPGSPYAYGWRLERGALLDVGPHLLDLHEVAFGEIVDVVAAGDPHGWVSLTLVHASGATSQASLSCRIAMESRTEVEVFASDGVVRFDGRDGDRREIGANIRASFAAVARGGSHPADARRGLHLQMLIEQAAQQLPTS